MEGIIKVTLPEDFTKGDNSKCPFNGNIEGLLTLMPFCKIAGICSKDNCPIELEEKPAQKAEMQFECPHKLERVFEECDSFVPKDDASVEDKVVEMFKRVNENRRKIEEYETPLRDPFFHLDECLDSIFDDSEESEDSVVIQKTFYSEHPEDIMLIRRLLNKKGMPERSLEEVSELYSKYLKEIWGVDVWMYPIEMNGTPDIVGAFATWLDKRGM